MAETDFKVDIPEDIPQVSPQEAQSFTWEQLYALCQQQSEMLGQLRVTIANLSETVAYLTRKIYGSSREKLPIAGQLDIFGNVYGEKPQEETPVMTVDEALCPEATPQKERKPRGKRKDLFDGVETEEVLVRVPDDARTCDICGKEMSYAGKEKVRSEIIITPIQVRQIVYYQEVLVCGNCKEEYGAFAYKKGEVPAALISHSMASPSAVAHIIFQKFINAMTFYRLEQELRGMGVPLGRETMAGWIIHCGLHVLQPLADELFRQQLMRDVLHGDETWCQVLKEPGKTPQSKSYIWLLATGDDGLPGIVTYHYSPTRAHQMAQDLLGDYTGYLHTDKYDGYDCLEEHLTRCLCWAHGRRKWYEAISNEIRDRDRSGLGIDELTAAEVGFLYCEKLFMIERKLKGLLPEEKRVRRLEKEKPVLDSYWAWLEGLKPLGGSKLEKAVNYFKDSREGFENYLKDGRCSLSNNWAENNARPYVVGRKNFLFHRSVDGANASAVIYSIVLTAKANNLDIRRYMEILLQEMPDYKNEPEGIEKLLPWSSYIQAECQKPGNGRRSGTTAS